MNHIYIGLGDLAKQELQTYQQLYQQAAMDQHTQLHAEYVSITESHAAGLNLLQPPESSHQPIPPMHHITINTPSIKAALMYLQEHRWLKLDEQEQPYWAQVIESNVQDLASLPKRAIRLSLAPTIGQLLFHIHEAYLRLQAAYNDEGLSLHLLVDTANLWSHAILGDVIVQLRQHYPSLFCRLSVYLLLPKFFGQQALSPALATSLYANLVEINALMNNSWMPDNILHDLPLNEDGNWLHVCHMVECHAASAQKEQGLAAYLLRKSQVKEQIWHESFFDEYADNHNTPPDGRFISFGVLRLAVTVDYPTEYYKKLFIAQLLNALLFAHWQDDQGYLPDEHPNAKQDFIGRFEALLQEWCLDLDYLTLNKLMTNDQSKLHPKWTSIELEWQRNREERLQHVQQLPIEQRPTALIQQYMDFYQERFRLKGVHHFYQQEWPASRVDGLAFKIVSGIEKTLIGLWWQADRGLAGMATIIQQVVSYLDEQALQLADARRNHEQRAEEHLAHYQGVSKQEQEGGEKRRLVAHNQELTLTQLDEHLYVAFTERTHVSSLVFAQRLLQRIKIRLGQLFEQVHEIFGALVITRNQYTKMLHHIEQISNKGVWVSHQQDTHLLQVTSSVYLQTHTMREQVLALPFEIKNYIKRFKNCIGQMVWQKAGLTVFADYLHKSEFQRTLYQIAEDYANHLDQLLSGHQNRPETSELIINAIGKMPEHRMQQLASFLSQLTQDQTDTYLPSAQTKPSQVNQCNAQLFVPHWVQTVDIKPVLTQMLHTSGLDPQAMRFENNLNNYLDLINVYHLDLPSWPAITAIAAQYEQQLHTYGDIQQAYFHWHSDYRLVNWQEYGLVATRLQPEEVREILIYAHALGWLDISLQGQYVTLLSKQLNKTLTEDGVPLAQVEEMVAMDDVLALRELQNNNKVGHMKGSCQQRLNGLLQQLKQLFARKDGSSNSTAQAQAANSFVAWQRSTLKVLRQLL